MKPGTRWDIFCTVIDNYGDIGITWRLARQLVREHGLQVRLWVDDLESFQHIQPEIRTEIDVQTFAGVEIDRWPTPFPVTEPGDVVIEALACHLPAEFEQSMARKPAKPIWINLEYLSAEDWVRGCHGLPSPHPRLPLTKYFFMPGYVIGTGGVLKELALPSTRDSFQTSATAQNAFWQSIGVPDTQSGETRISLFSYESPAIGNLLACWADGQEPIRCLIPAGKSLGDVCRFFDHPDLSVGMSQNRGRLTVHILHMLDQDTYDRLLWACDCNFVRGEDSFVRAMWAGKPLIWQAYRQEKGAHWPKIEAFLDSYCAGLDTETANVLRQFWHIWNENGDAGRVWPHFWRHRERWIVRSATWQSRLDEIGDLASNLVKFCNEKSE
jgi:uncharacterized repeat protein (TIGR03837 family)